MRIPKPFNQALYFKSTSNLNPRIQARPFTATLTTKMPMPIDRLVERNAMYAETTHKRPPNLLGPDGNPRSGAPGILIISCVDPRIIPERFFALNFANLPGLEPLGMSHTPAI